MHGDTEIPRIAITVGDAAGVGPELALRCSMLDRVRQICHPVVMGPASVLQRVANLLDLTCPEKIDGLESRIDTCVMLDVGCVGDDGFTPGKVNADTGKASFDAVDFAIGAALRGKVDAIVTGPIHKEAWNAAGIEFPGHTELLADRTNVDDFCMMLTSNTISCVLVTIHIPLADVPESINAKNVGLAIQLGADALRQRLGRDPRITVCGLNPHAGENGLFSRGEEETVIRPAIQRAVKDGLNVTGPLPPDTAFTPSMREQTDVYVCMYHDQGLIPLKAISFDDAVNVTLGLPIVRTSVDHGTALDIAWQGKANHQSMLSAIEMAVSLVGK